MTTLINTNDLPHSLNKNFAAPRAAVQGAMFSSQVFRGRTVRPVYEEKKLVAEYGKTQVFQTAGEQLDQGDADVYFELVRRAVEQDDLSVAFKSDEFLNAINRDRGTENRKWLQSSIERLKNACFEFEISEWPVKAKMFASVACKQDSKTTNEYVIVLSDSMSEAFEKGKTIIKTSERKALGNDSLAKALHAFFSSHSKQFESKISIEKLMKLTGRDAMRKDRFVEALTKSIKLIAEVTNWSIKLEANVLKVKQCESVKTDIKTKKPLTTPTQSAAATKAAGTSVETPKAKEPAPANTWDGVESVEDLDKFELSKLVSMMNWLTKQKYDDIKSKDKIDFESWRQTALHVLAEQFDDMRAFKASEEAYAEFATDDDDI